MTSQIPEIYRHLLERVEQIEAALSQKAMNSSEPATLFMTSDHANEAEIPEVDEDLETEKVDPIVLSSKAFLKIAIHAKKYANKSIKKSKWVEVIGLMTGHVINEGTPMEQIVINEAWPVGHGDAVSAEIMNTSSVTSILSEVPKGDFIIGWYHSHPSYTPFMSETDYATQSRYQALWSKAIALVVDPVMISASNYGFGVYRNTSKEPGSKGYTELSTFVDGISTKAAYDTIKLLTPALEGRDLAQEFKEYE